MKRALVFAVLLACLLPVWTGSAAAAGGSGSARACSALPKNSDHGRILVSVDGWNVAPSQKRFAACAQAQKVVAGVTAKRIEVPSDVAGFRCTPFVLKTEPAVVKYSCLLRGAEEGTGVKDVFKVVYSKA
jgi:hypothetical protein